MGILRPLDLCRARIMHDGRQAYGHRYVRTDICPDYANATREHVMAENETETGDACESAHLGKAASTLDCDVGGGCLVRRDGIRTTNVGVGRRAVSWLGMRQCLVLGGRGLKWVHDARTLPSAGMMGRICT